MALSTLTQQPPFLVSGDRLTRDEFERRCAAMPEVKKAELIEGVVYMQAAVRFTQHGSPQAYILAWLAGYDIETPGVAVADNATVRLDMDNEPQPDGLLIIEPDCGGQAQIDQDGYLSGAPELVAEVAGSSASYDLHDKLNAYRRNGVREYLVWRVLDEAFDWFILRGGNYEQLDPNDAGVIASEVFPGLWLAPQALLARDMATVMKRLQDGLAAPEHARFVEQLRQAQKSGE